MRSLAATRALLHRPFATANREALGFVVMFYGGIAAALALIALLLWLLLG